MITHSIKDSSWWSTNTTIQDWVVLRPKSPSKKAVPVNHAKQWAAAEDPIIGYNITAAKDDDNSFYCSKLVWRAYDLAGVNLQVPKGKVLNVDIPEWIVAPIDLYNQESFEVQSGKKPKARLAFVGIAKQPKIADANMQSQFAPLLEPAITTTPAHLMLIDTQGRRTGYDSVTGAIVNEIPEAIYSGPDAMFENITVTNFDGDWQAIVTGVEAGDYRLVAEFLDVIDPKVQTIDGRTEPGQIDQFTISPPDPVIYLPIINR
ncbi:MAG: hypothetical protein R3A44_42575 [Caldilineaceae bacterium]